MPTTSSRSELTLKDAVFVGHSVSAMIGVLASLKAPGMSGARRRATSTTSATSAASASSRSPNSSNSWRTTTWGGPRRWRRPAWAIRIDRNLARNSLIAFAALIRRSKAFVRVTFTSYNRADLPTVSAPTLILQCKEDIIASTEVGDFVHDQIPGSKMASSTPPGTVRTSAPRKKSPPRCRRSSDS
jgi:sigma-B regulation protein RsbQ